MPNMPYNLWTKNLKSGHSAAGRGKQGEKSKSEFASLPLQRHSERFFQILSKNYEDFLPSKFLKLHSFKLFWAKVEQDPKNFE